MRKNNAHIVSKFRWDTVFSNREQAFPLQERLSDWSRIHLQREIEKVFDRLCPAEQTWKIDLLEIDLGQIDYDNLEPELTERIGNCLSLRLMEKIIYAGNNGATIEITTGEVSESEKIIYFLLNGMLPWNTTGCTESVNDLLAEQLHSNFRGIIDMIAIVGKETPAMRKRMAWQISETNLIKVLEGLEPGNHIQIIEFRKELETIQQEQKVVSVGLIDFRKQIWEWVLNYIFVERGSVFNEVSFMKSNIRQMASHYNTSYDQMLSAIEEAAGKIHILSAASAGFIAVLTEISNEKKRLVNATVTGETKDYWYLLEQWLKGNTTKEYSSKRLNELIASLSSQDYQRFQSLVYTLSLSLQTWTSVTKRLTVVSLEIMVKAMDSRRAGFIMEAIALLSALCKQQQILLNKPLLWAAGIRNLRQNRDAATGNRLFMMDCILCLGKTSQVSWEKMLVQLLGANIPERYRTRAALDVFTALSDLFLIEISNRPPSFFNRQFVEQLTSLYALLEQPVVNREKREAIQQSLRQYIRLYPSGSLELLVRYTASEKIPGLFRELIDGYTAGVLLEHAAAGTYHELLETFIKQLKQTGVAASGTIISWLENHLKYAGLRVAFLFPQASINFFADKVLQELLVMMPSSLKPSFMHIMQAILATRENHRLEVFYLAIEKLPVANTSATQVLLPFIVDEWLYQNQEKHVIIKSLCKNFTLHSLINLPHKNAIALADYLLPGASKILHAAAISITRRLRVQVPAAKPDTLTAVLYEIFWKCLLDHMNSNVRAERFERMFINSLHQHFSLIIAQKNNKQKVIAVNAVASLSPAKIYELLKYSLEHSVPEVVYQHHSFSLQEMIKYLMYTDIRSLYKILSNLTLTDQRISFISANLSFGELRACMMDRYSPAVTAALGDMDILLELAYTMCTDSVAQAIEKELQKESLLMLSGEQWTSDSAYSYLRRINIPVNELFNMITTSERQPGQVLRKALVDHVPSLSDLLPETLHIKSSCLSDINSKGLLETLIHSMISFQQLPSWLKVQDDEPKDATTVLNELILHYPFSFVCALGKKELTEYQFQWLEMSIKRSVFFHSIACMHVDRRMMLMTIEQLYIIMADITIKGISGSELQSVLFKSVLNAWIGSKWDKLSINAIWNSLSWDICLKTGVEKTVIMSAMRAHKTKLPLSLQVSLEQYIQTDTDPLIPAEIKVIRGNTTKKGMPYFAETATGQSIAVKNAGIVLLNSYIPVLFERMGITDKGVFIHRDAQIHAVHYLQYLITGEMSTEEHLLPLNKILCGLDISEPVTDAVLLTDDQRAMMEDLLYAVISHWPDSGSHSQEGLRGNWFVRNGILRKEESGWELNVEHKPYDLLLQRSPFSFSVIKFPWMQNPLTVKWKY